MTIAELYQGLVDTGLPVTYYDWTSAETVPQPPYIAYLYSYSNSLMAGDRNVYSRWSFTQIRKTLQVKSWLRIS